MQSGSNFKVNNLKLRLHLRKSINSSSCFDTSQSLSSDLRGHNVEMIGTGMFNYLQGFLVAYWYRKVFLINGWCWYRTCALNCLRLWQVNNVARSERRMALHCISAVYKWLFPVHIYDGNPPHRHVRLIF